MSLAGRRHQSRATRRCTAVPAHGGRHGDLPTGPGQPAGCCIAAGSRIGAVVEILKGATIGANCRISSRRFICEGRKLADDAFIGHDVRFTDDIYPGAVTADSALQTEADWQMVEALVRTRAPIGRAGTRFLPASPSV